MVNNFCDTKIVSYSLNQLFELILDVESYKDFLPWVCDNIIVSKTIDNMIVDTVIKFHMITKNYRSNISFGLDNDNAFVRIKAVPGVFNVLNTSWILKKQDINNTEIAINLDFEFHSKSLDSIAGVFLNQVSEKMIDAFLKEANRRFN